MNDVIDTLWPIAVPVVYALGVGYAIHALFTVRSPQGTVGWVLSLVLMPWIGLPLYWVFGRGRFSAYVARLREESLVETGHTPRVLEDLKHRVSPDHARDPVLETLAHTHFTCGNRFELLIDGDATFDAIKATIDGATDYVVIAFFIIHADDTGERFRSWLVDAVERGVRVYVLYDEVGSHDLPSDYIDGLRWAGVNIRAFHTTQGSFSRLQLNFRNHRKLVVADGRVALVGGHNVGDEYLGLGDLGTWRDTHVELRGPVVLDVQLAWLGDWYWATHKVPELSWVAEDLPEDGVSALAIATGPTDYVKTCEAMFVHAIHRAQDRCWIASPYLIPSGAVMVALQLAAMREVDVRLLIPEKGDHWVSWLAAFAFVKDLRKGNVRIYRYDEGFMHQKALLVDDDLSMIGTANLDNRSMFLNFELTIAALDHAVAEDVAAMFHDDFERSTEVVSDELADRSWLFETLVRAARLFSPVV